VALGSQRPQDVEEQRAARIVESALRVAVHETRQPLAAVFALAESARSLPGVSPEVRQRLDQIIEQAQELSGALTSALSRTVGEPTADGDPADVEEIVDSVVQAFRLTWSGTISWRGGRRGAGSFVVGGRDEVRRALMNVVDNAVRAAGPHGRVLVTVRRGPASVRILVEDDGPGFGNVSGGTGLGLAITRQALEVLGGGLSILLPSKPGGGCVALSLPLASGDEDVDQPVPAG
jgi:signal transduction histidine kinase